MELVQARQGEQRLREAAAESMRQAERDNQRVADSEAEVARLEVALMKAVRRRSLRVCARAWCASPDAALGTYTVRRAAPS